MNILQDESGCLGFKSGSSKYFVVVVLCSDDTFCQDYFNIRMPSRIMKNPFDHPPNPLPSQEGGKDYIWGTPPDPCQRGKAPLDSPFFAAC
jgi:hypothetical protein